MDATCAIQASIHVFSLVRKYVSRILGTYHFRRQDFTVFLLLYLFTLLKSQSSGCDIAYLGRSVVLDCSREYIRGLNSPLISVCFKIFEWLTIKLNKCFLDNRLVLAMSSLDIHHLGDRHTACNPLTCRCGQVGNLGKVSCVAVLDQHECVVSKGIAVIRIKV